MAGVVLGQAALDCLEAECAQGNEEASMSSYWRHFSRFNVTAAGDVSGYTTLGTLSRKTGAVRRAAHWVLQAPFRRSGRRLSRFREFQSIGRNIAQRQGRQFSHDMLRQVLSLAQISEFIPIDAMDGHVAVIGDGYGVMSALLLNAFPEKRVIAVNLLKPLLVDLAFASRATPGVGLGLVSDNAGLERALAQRELRLIALRADNASLLERAPIGLAINIVSMQEMDPTVIDLYFHCLRANPAERTALYCCNRLVKRRPLYDEDDVHVGNAGEVRFEDYPWRQNDDKVLDSVCSWSQMYYDARPPFWHVRRGQDRVVWHRLAYLEKDRG